MAELLFALQHKTSRRFLTGMETETSRAMEAAQYPSRDAAEGDRTSLLAPFSEAWEVVPLVGIEWPEEFPGAWQHWPAELQRVARGLIADYWVREFGPADLVKQVVTNGGRERPLVDGKPLPLDVGAERFWRMFLDRARVHLGKRVDPHFRKEG